MVSFMEKIQLLPISAYHFLLPFSLDYLWPVTQRHQWIMAMTMLRINRPPTGKQLTRCTRTSSASSHGSRLNWPLVVVASAAATWLASLAGQWWPCEGKFDAYYKRWEWSMLAHVWPTNVAYLLRAHLRARLIWLALNGKRCRRCSRLRRRSCGPRGRYDITLDWFVS